MTYSPQADLFVAIVNAKGDKVTLALFRVQDGALGQLAEIPVDKVPCSESGGVTHKPIDRIKADCGTFSHDRQEMIFADALVGGWWVFSVRCFPSSTYAAPFRLRIRDQDKIICLCLDDESHYVYGAIRSGVKVWSALAGELLLNLPDCHENLITTMTFCPHTKHLGTACIGESSTYIWTFPALYNEKGGPSRVPVAGGGTSAFTGVLLSGTKPKRLPSEDITDDGYLFALDGDNVLRVFSRQESGIVLVAAYKLPVGGQAAGTKKKKGKKNRLQRKDAAVAQFRVSCFAGAGRFHLLVMIGGAVTVLELHTPGSASSLVHLPSSPLSCAFVRASESAAQWPGAQKEVMLALTSTAQAHRVDVIEGAGKQLSALSLPATTRVVQVGHLEPVSHELSSSCRCQSYSADLRSVLVGWSDGRVDVIAAASGTRLRVLQAATVPQEKENATTVVCSFSAPAQASSPAPDGKLAI
jgi:hypothetical protein